MHCLSEWKNSITTLDNSLGGFFLFVCFYKVKYNATMWPKNSSSIYLKEMKTLLAEKLVQEHSCFFHNTADPWVLGCQPLNEV